MSKLAELYKNNWFAIGLLVTGALITLITFAGLLYNPDLFSSYTVISLSVICAIASYMLYNIKKLSKEVKNT